MSQSSQYAHQLTRILAALHTPGDEQEPALPDEEARDTIHVYPVEGGGVLFSPVPLKQQDDEDDEPSVIDSLPPVPRPATRGQPPRFLVFVLLLCTFLLLDAANSQLAALLTPTVTLTLTPDVRRLSLQSSAALGKLLSPITLTESQTVPTTGHGHQDAARATGTLTFYNGLSTAQAVAAGTLISEQDGVRVAIDATVTVPPANPPSLGATSVSAHALQAGAAGNIQAGDIATTLSAGLYIKNLAAFAGGQDARDFQIVTKADRDTTAAVLRQKVTTSMTAAVQEQLTLGQTLHQLPCAPSTRADHVVGEEATRLTVTISETCTATAYDMQQLMARATYLLTTQAAIMLGTGYLLFGNVQVSVTKATPTRVASLLALTFTCQGTYVYTLNVQAQQRIIGLVAGTPRLVALRLLLHQRGIHMASIAGISDNQPLPDDQTHIHLLMVIPEF